MGSLIQFESFCFEAAPRVGAAWFLEVADLYGFKQLKEHQVSIKASIVRHPFKWLQSIYLNPPTVRYYSNSMLNRIIHFRHISTSPFDFFERVTEIPNTISTVFDWYEADTVMRFEDFPWAPVEFFKSFIDYPTSVQLPPKTNESLQFMGFSPAIEKELSLKVVRSNKEFCERYDYF